MLAALALTVALSMQIVGVLLIAALMVLPVTAATRIGRSLASTLLLSIAIGLGSVFLGLTTSYCADLPPGGTIVLVAAAAVVAAATAQAFSPRCGRRPPRRRPARRPAASVHSSTRLPRAASGR